MYTPEIHCTDAAFALGNQLFLEKQKIRKNEFYTGLFSAISALLCLCVCVFSSMFLYHNFAKISFNTSFSTGLLVISVLFLSEKVFNSHSFLKGVIN
jgi:hypothetical protein